MTYQEEFIVFMVRSGVLTFGDFTTKSGRKTPYFINTGNYKTGAQADALGSYYAACIHEHLGEAGGADVLFGPAYKGIPLVVTAAASLYRNYGEDYPYAFNRKEKKDHGEGGNLVGAKIKDGDRIAIVEDVVTAGTAVRETIALFETIAPVKINALFVSVVGPTRMDYAQVAAKLTYFAEGLGKMFSKALPAAPVESRAPKQIPEPPKQED